MQETKNWEYYPLNEESYADLYAKGFSTYGYEVLYIRDKKLVGVDIVDFLEDGVSSIYFYYDPDYRAYSLGKYSIYKQIEFAKKRDLKWIYIGYSVKDCASLNYKENYKPHQVLKNSPSLDCKAIWSFD
jgi:arginine-tRNA-protein transferase